MNILMRLKSIIITLMVHTCLVAQNSESRIIEYQVKNDSINKLLIYDFSSGYSLFIDYYIPNVKQTEGSFDLTTYDSLQFYTDTIQLLQSPIDGTTWQIVHEFHAMKSGLWSYYYSNGILHCQGNYYRNLREGEWKYYSDKGELQICRVYSAGKILSQKILKDDVYLIPD